MVFKNMMSANVLGAVIVSAVVISASAMDDKRDLRSGGNWNPTATKNYTAAKKQEKDGKDHPISQDTKPLERYIKQSGGNTTPLINTQDSRNFADDQRVFLAKVQKEEATRLALLEKKQIQEDKRKTSMVLGQQQSDQKLQELRPYYDQFEDFELPTESPKKKQSSKKTSHKKPSNSACGSIVAPVVSSQEVFGFEGTDNSMFATPHGSPKKSTSNFSTARPAHTRSAQQGNPSRQQDRTEVTLQHAQHSQGTVDRQFKRTFQPNPSLQIDFSSDD